MNIEKKKMLEGKLYNPNDKELVNERKKCHRLCLEYNLLFEDNPRRNDILNELGIKLGKNIFLQGPIYFDYGFNISFGDNSYANFNLTILDTCKVSVGKDVFIGPNVSLVTPIHPLRYQERNIRYLDNGSFSDLEYGKEIIIEDNCWIASNVVICGGVTIGEGSVIGAGSVVVKSIPKNSLAAGNPCRVIREINEKDKII